MYLTSYSAGEEKSPYFLFHGETALRKIVKFKGETPNFSEKFQGEIAEFSVKTWSFIGKVLKFQGEIQVFPGENIGFPGETWRNFPLFLPVSPWKRGSWSWRKIKSGDFSSPALYLYYVTHIAEYLAQGCLRWRKARTYLGIPGICLWNHHDRKATQTTLSLSIYTASPSLLSILLRTAWGGGNSRHSRDTPAKPPRLEGNCQTTFRLFFFSIQIYRIFVLGWTRTCTEELCCSVVK